MAAALMAVPEAAMHEHDGAVFREHEIGTPRQRPGVKAVAQSGRVEEAPETQLGPRTAQHGEVGRVLLAGRLQECAHRRVGGVVAEQGGDGIEQRRLAVGAFAPAEGEDVLAGLSR